MLLAWSSAEERRILGVLLSSIFFMGEGYCHIGNTAILAVVREVEIALFSVFLKKNQTENSFPI